MTTITAERITFRSEGIELVGHLRLADTGDRRAAVALTGPLTGVKEQVTGTYAELLTMAGLTTLAFDHRGFGESGGRHQHEDSQGKLADLRAAVSALAARDEVDPARIGLAGSALAAATPSGPRPPIPASRRWPQSPAATTAPRRWHGPWASRHTGPRLPLPWSVTTNTCQPSRRAAGRPR